MHITFYGVETSMKGMDKGLGFKPLNSIERNTDKFSLQSIIKIKTSFHGWGRGTSIVQDLYKPHRVKINKDEH